MDGQTGYYDFAWFKGEDDEWDSWFDDSWEEYIYLGDDEEDEEEVPAPAPVAPKVEPKSPKAPKRTQPQKPKQPKRPKANKEDLKNIVTVKSIDFHVKDNTARHRTKLYVRTRESKDDKGNVVPGALVVRRGDDFKLTLKLNREYDEKNDDLWISFSNGDNPRENKGTFVEIPLAEKDKDKQRGPKKWSAKLTSKTKDSIDVTMRVPATSVVGEWKVSVKTVTAVTDKDGNETKKSFVFSKNKPSYVVTILFNPWCKDDLVYMPETKLLDEYVLNDSTCVYQMGYFGPIAKAWAVGQFEEVCLVASLQILDQAKVKVRSDPVLLSRHIAKMVNCFDDNGVLVGNWSGEYDDGTPPNKWNGSQAILKQYVAEGTPVKYGQCWVFSMLTNTVCRSLGIPCRGVTNKDSAHDTDESCTIDKIYKRNKETGHLKPARSDDSIWNYHVWNDVWLVRNDLIKHGAKPGEYDGWQAIDATPQELSKGIFTCGPAPLKAIKNGECWIPYDAPFVFSEVNADVIHWVKSGDTMTRFKLETRKVGSLLVTKDPKCRPFFKDKRLYVTDEYKHKEGSKEEAEAIKTAYEAAGEHARKGAYTPVEDNQNQLVKVDLKLPAEKVTIGSDLDIAVVLLNTGHHHRTLRTAVLALRAQSYTGISGPIFFQKNLLESKHETQLDAAPEYGAAKEKTFMVKVSAKGYFEHLIEKANVLVEAQIEVDRVNRAEQKQTTLVEEPFTFAKPPLNVTCAERCDISTPVEFTLSFTNPLDMPLTNCSVVTESTVGFENIDDQIQGDVPPRGEINTTISIMPTIEGTHTAVFSFECNQLVDVEGTAAIEIFDPAAAN